MNPFVFTYLGTDKETVDRFTRLLNELGCPLLVFENYKLWLKAATRISNLEQSIVLFYEKKANYEADYDILNYIKSHRLNTFIILVTDGLSDAGEAKHYLDAGVNESISPNAAIEAFQHMLRLLSSIQDKKTVEIAHDPDLVETFASFHLPIGKRLFDIFFSLVILLFLFPLFLIISLAIRLESKGPIIYKSKRVGTNYKVFDFLKFRSMYMDADARLKEYKKFNQYHSADPVQDPAGHESIDDYHGNFDDVLVDDTSVQSEKTYAHHQHLKKENAFFKLERDPRVTKVGRILRKFSLDELPQLINILKGDMSVVGNRPLPMYEAELLTTDDAIERFMAPAGLTGLWQVEKRGDSGRLSAQERNMLDIDYARHYSIWMDIKILFKTFTAFIQKEDV